MLSFRVLWALSTFTNFWRQASFVSFLVLPSNCRFKHASFLHPSSGHDILCFFGLASFRHPSTICSKLQYHSHIFLQDYQLIFASSPDHFWAIWWSLPFGAAPLKFIFCTLLCYSLLFPVEVSAPISPSWKSCFFRLRKTAPLLFIFLSLCLDGGAHCPCKPYPYYPSIPW